MATKKRSNKAGTKKRENREIPPIIDDSPITVGGGGGGENAAKRKLIVPAYVLFHRYTDYPTATTGSNKKKLFQRAAPVRRLIVTINHVEYDLSPWIPGDAKDCQLAIKCKGTNEHIDMFIEHAGVKFHTGKYPPELGNQHPSLEADNFINKVTFKTPLQPYKFEWKDLTPADEVSVFIDIA